MKETIKEKKENKDLEKDVKYLSYDNYSIKLILTYLLYKINQQQDLNELIRETSDKGTKILLEIEDKTYGFNLDVKNENKLHDLFYKNKEIDLEEDNKEVDLEQQKQD